MGGMRKNKLAEKTYTSEKRQQCIEFYSPQYSYLFWYTLLPVPIQTADDSK